MLAKQPTMPAQFGKEQKSASSRDSEMKDMFQAKSKAEWDVLRHKVKKAYADLLAGDYQGVEADGKGERNEIQAVNEVAATNVFNYTLSGSKT